MKKLLKEALLDEFTNKTNRSNNQTLELSTFCVDLKELILLEKAIKYLNIFYCPANRYEVLFILTKYEIERWFKEELFIKY